MGGWRGGRLPPPSLSVLLLQELGPGQATFAAEVKAPWPRQTWRMPTHAFNPQHGGLPAGRAARQPYVGASAAHTPHPLPNSRPPKQVSYTCKAANLYYDAGFNLSQAGTLFVVDHYLSTGYLWDL